MRIEKNKRKVTIVCEDGSLIKGIVHIDPGYRLSDFLNSEKEKFIAVTEAELLNTQEVQSFRLFNGKSKRKRTVILNKQSIRLAEDVQ